MSEHVEYHAANRPADHTEHASQHHVVSIGSYIAVLTALMVLLVVTVGASFIDFDKHMSAMHLGTGWSTGVAILIAVIKAVLIVLIFMHVRWGSKTTWVFAASSFVWLGIMIVLMMVDYFSRNAPMGANPKGEPYYFPSQIDPQVTGLPSGAQGPILPETRGPVSNP